MVAKAWWITGSNGLPLSDGRIIANTYEEADRILFLRMVHGQCLTDCTLEEEDVPEEVEDSNIISVTTG